MVQVGRRMARLCDEKRPGVKTRVSTLALQLMTSASPGPASRARFCLWPEGWPGSGHGLGQGASWPLGRPWTGRERALVGVPLALLICMSCLLSSDKQSMT